MSKYTSLKSDTDSFIPKYDIVYPDDNDIIQEPYFTTFRKYMFIYLAIMIIVTILFSAYVFVNDYGKNMSMFMIGFTVASGIFIFMPNFSKAKKCIERPSENTYPLRRTF